MAEAGTRVPDEQAYYTTANALGTGTTSTQAMMVWRALNDHLLHNLAPMTGAELAAVTVLPMEMIAGMFNQEYYLRAYGFRRFETLDAWRAWAEDYGLLYVPGKHDVLVEDEDEVADEDDLEEDEVEA